MAPEQAGPGGAVNVARAVGRPGDPRDRAGVRCADGIIRAALDEVPAARRGHSQVAPREHASRPCGARGFLFGRFDWE